MFLALVASATAAIAIPLARAGVHRSPLSPTRIQSSSINTCPGYTASNIVKTDSTLSADLKLAGTACNVYGTDLVDLKLLVEYQTNDRLHVKIYDAGLNVYQVPESFMPRPQSQNAESSGAAIQFSVVESPFSFTVTRTGTNEVLFDTSGVPLIFESQYVRLRTKLPASPNIYGLGEHSDSFRLPTTNYVRTMWNSESPFIPRNSNLYGSHPMYFDHRGNAGTHGVFLWNSNGMDIKIDNNPTDGQYLEYNTIGGVIDLYFMAGPGPVDVSKQYAEVVGLPAMMPYWAFGFHQCKYGYYDVLMVAEVVANYSNAGIPLETMWTDINYMDGRKDFTVDPDRFPMHKMQELVTTLHNRDQHYVLILDPGIHPAPNYPTYSRGEAQGVFLKNSTQNGEYEGVGWPGVISFPDWFAPNTQQWLTNEFQTFFNPTTGIDIDAVWVDMNEASNNCGGPGCPIGDNGNPPAPSTSPRPNTGRPINGFPPDFNPPKSKPKRQSSGIMTGLPGRDLLNPPYHIANHWGTLSDFTIWTDIINTGGTAQYDTHNLYGTMHAHAAHAAMLARRPTQRPMVLTRSTFAGAGAKVAHWFGDNDSNWSDYRISIAQMLAFASMLQMPMVGSDVCGFNGNTTPDLCARWAFLGAFYPFYRNHADTSSLPQEFYLWPLVADAAKNAIATRYKLLDYIYTAMYRQSETGTPLINPLFFVYPNDAQTFGIDLQFFYGPSLLVSPVTVENSTSVDIYLPDDIFYDFWTWAPVQGQGSYTTLNDIDYNTIPLHIRGGSIIPVRNASANTTTALRQESFYLIIAPGRDGTARGELYIDDGESIVQEGGVTDVVFTWDGSNFETQGDFGFGGGKRGESIVVEKVVVLGQGEVAGDSDKAVGSREKRAVTVQGPWGLGGGFRFRL
ncbi:glycoside hydrolase family 31 protein [Lepidopterella palustris CBS 459.81]|uniref:alpha-glucosidase n=1 Tax=Lepidopterella palustris CBS 459.81 TaxID=1314670 RepID=A0A8E2JGK9_9PEZI|nr:glycoside hydrolase family 31 protein [Lepidopterella palustris CBS 459.81]